jgi:Protein of unknown function (DUF3575)
MRYTQALAIAAATALVPATAHAQTEATKTAVVHQQVLSTNPLGEIAQWFNVEYERKIGLATTLGVAASTYKYMDYTSASLLLRWYPQDAALDGFYLGARTGAYRFGNYRLGYSSVLPGVGLEIGHAWLFGQNRNVSVSVGFGLTRLFGDRANGYDAPTFLPNARLANVGIAF